MAQCRICGNRQFLKFYNVKERQLNEGEQFRYLLCPKCRTMQLDQNVKHMERYYGKEYYSFHRKSPRMHLPKAAVKPVLHISSQGFGWRGNLFRLFAKTAVLSKSVYASKANFYDSIIDVGGGNGLLASFLKKNGFLDVTCIDKFCSEPLTDKIKFRQCGIEDLSDEKKYDLILFESSFEHMEHPHEVIEKIRKILSKDGKCLIKIPVMDSKAWSIYRENWYQIDAPRHYFLYSVRALRWMCKQHGLKVNKVIYFSGSGQFFTSKWYHDSDLSFQEINQKYTELSWQEKRKYELMARQADESHTGDTAWFYISHNHQ